jgi:60 kDa SS-A/Ro ribonucleoprotein
MRFNTVYNVPRTFEGGKSEFLSYETQLKRISMTCMLWEDTFYVDGKTTAEAIKEICKHLSGDIIVAQALESFVKGKLRHIPLFLIVEALKKKCKCKEVIDTVCNRPDQMTELLSLYWKENGSDKPLAAQLKKGLAMAFRKFDAYQLAKYNRKNPVKLKDVLFLTHPKPKDKKQEDDWKMLISDTLPIPNTWETKLSSGEKKEEVFTSLLEENKLGKLALVRNLRNIFESGVKKALVEKRLLGNDLELLPFQFIAAAKHCPAWEDIIDKSMIQSMQEMKKFSGKTILLVDVSGSMISPLSEKSEISRMDAACGLSILLREICEEVEIYSFSEFLALIPSRRGMALRDAIIKSQPSTCTYLGAAISALTTLSFDRMIVITDEQSRDDIPDTNRKHNYIINIAPYKKGVATNKNWHTINGFSENIIDYIHEYEAV